MLVDKKTSNLHGTSIFFTSGVLGIDLYIKENKISSNNKNLSFYFDADKIDIIVNYNDINKTVLKFLQKNSNNEEEFFLLNSITLEKFLKKGNAIMFNTIPSHLDLLGKERTREVYTAISNMNNSEFENNEKINYAKLFESFLKEVLHIRNNDIATFEDK